MASTEQPQQHVEDPSADGDDAVVPRETRSTTTVRVVVVSAAVLAVLMLGATLGLLVIGLVGIGQQSTPGAGSVDVGFSQDMSAHHLQAVQIASWDRDHSTDPEIRQIAFDLETTQQDQVGRMEGWLSLWGQPELMPPDRSRMSWMANAAGHIHGATAVALGNRMPGMATPEELVKLRSLSGTALDVYFLQLMIRHHQGGAPMAQYTAVHASEPAVRALADNIAKWQDSELRSLTSLLTARGGAPLPPN